MLLNPKKLDKTYPDPETEAIMKKTIDFFETMGLAKCKDDYHSARWYTEFLDFMEKEQIMAKLLTPEGYGENARWDTSRIVEFAEILGFYGLTYWYCFQVSALGLGPIWIGNNEDVKHKAARLLKEGAIFGFGLSEKSTGPISIPRT